MCAIGIYIVLSMIYNLYIIIHLIICILSISFQAGRRELKAKDVANWLRCKTLCSIRSTANKQMNKLTEGPGSHRIEKPCLRFPAQAVRDSIR